MLTYYCMAEKEEMLLESISEKLDRIISLLRFSNVIGLDEYKNKVFGNSKIKLLIYDLCDGKKTVNEMSRILNKSNNHVSMELSELEKSGLIEAKRKGKEKYYFRVL